MNRPARRRSSYKKILEEQQQQQQQPQPSSAGAAAPSSSAANSYGNNNNTTMDGANRKIELQSPEDLTFLINNVRRAAAEHIGAAFPPVEGDDVEEDELRIRIEHLVNDVRYLFPVSLSSEWKTIRALHLPCARPPALRPPPSPLLSQSRCQTTNLTACLSAYLTNTLAYTEISTSTRFSPSPRPTSPSTASIWTHPPFPPSTCPT